MVHATPGGAVAGRTTPSCQRCQKRIARGRWRRIALILSAHVLASCGDSSVQVQLGPTTPIDLEAAAVAVVAGDAQEASVGSLVPSPLVIQVLDPAGNPVPNAPILWEFQAGKGRAPSDGSTPQPRLTTRTDATGTSSVLWELGPTAGPQSASAEIVIEGSSSTAGGPLPAPGGNGGGNGKKVGFTARASATTPSYIAVTPAEIVVPEGQSVQLQAEVRDQYGNLVEGTQLGWVSTDGTIATVGSAGNVSALNTGTATISATWESLRADASVVVVGSQYAEIDRVIASPDSIDLGAPGDTTSVSVAAQNSFGQPISGITFEFSSSDSSVVEVDSMGRLRAKATGTAVIAAVALCCGESDAVVVQVGGSTDTLTITVIDQNSIVVSDLDMQVGDSAALDALASNALGLSLGQVSASWSSSNVAVASVTTGGVVYAHAAGSANVFATYQNVTATVPVTVTSTTQPPPPPPPPPPGTWPSNEPAGMTVITSTDGSDKYFGTGGSGPGWFFGGRWNDNTYVEDGISDSSSRYGSVIQKRLFAGDPAGWNGLAEFNWSSTAGVKRHMYYRASFKFSNNYQICSTNEKPHGYVGGPGGDGADIYVYMFPNGAWSMANEFPGAGFNDINLNFTMTRGQWITLEMYFVAESSAGASDGERRIWINGTQVSSATGVNWGSGAPGWSQIDIFNYWGGGGCTKTVNDVISISEIYVSGK